MATLSKHGYEHLRLRREYTIVSLDDQPKRYFEELSYRSDGKILRKSGCWQEATTYTPAHWHIWPWKLYRKLKEGIDPQDHAETLKDKLDPTSCFPNPQNWQVQS